MAGSDSDKLFAGSIPRLYQDYLVPLIFQPYATAMAALVAARPVTRALEVAAGTGVVTRALAFALPTEAEIIATDLNQPMLDLAREVRHPAASWRQADAQHLPFADGYFDVVVCQFGAMFFPDKPKAFSEARRVLRPGGAFVFNVWDTIEENEMPNVITLALQALFPQAPPRFLARTPHGYHRRADIERDLRQAGFEAPPQFQTLAARSRAASADIPALAFCQGTPLRNEIEALGGGLQEATEAATQALTRHFGPGPVDGKIQAHIIVSES